MDFTQHGETDGERGIMLLAEDFQHAWVPPGGVHTAGTVSVRLSAGHRRGGEKARVGRILVRGLVSICGGRKGPHDIPEHRDTDRVQELD
jgi:hypothetical protein